MRLLNDFVTTAYVRVLYFLQKNFNNSGWVILLSVLVILALDSLLLDDEPLWEPLEWSVMQTWVLYIYILTWASEVIFSSRYGSYTNRDKIVWIGLFRVYYGLIYWFFINIIVVTVFITLPFYFEITYMISYSVVWWNWLSSVFFFKFLSVLMVALSLLLILKQAVRWLPIAHLRLLLAAVIFLLSIIFFFQSLTTWFSYFTDVSEFQKSGWSEMSRIVNGPLKWGWGSDSRDHFAYHQTPTSFWAKNDPLILGSLLFINVFLFLFMFFLILQVLVYYWVAVSSGELSHNGLSFIFSTVQFFIYLVFILFLLVVLSLLYQFIRFPVELFYYLRFIQLFKLQWLVIVDFLNCY